MRDFYNALSRWAISLLPWAALVLFGVGVVLLSSVDFVLTLICVAMGVLLICAGALAAAYWFAASVIKAADAVRTGREK